MTRALVLVTGTGRSGTSTMSGILHHLGLYVPGPYLGANKSNPKGFYESRWAVEFHKRLTSAAGVDPFDSRPTAFDRVQRAVTPTMRAELVAFVREHAADHEQVVVKDPRSVWAQRLWKEAAAEVGLDCRYVSMLRHPAEVVGSRATHYAKQADEAQRRAYEIVSVARWVNNQLISERETRGEVRAFVGYVQLLEDWRPVLAELRDSLSLRFDAGVEERQPHPVDEFIDPDLRRSRVTWGDLDVPRDLQHVAQGVWESLGELREARGTLATASAELDRLGAEYERSLAQAAAMAHDLITGARIEGREEGARQVRDARRARPQRDRPRPEDRRIRDVGGRELLGEAGRRAWGRFRPR
ncbi:MAG TPA: sulfotransferase [Nocardioidaceae bacterium]|nr:sulfotransferase [Nocardioidaceae bacterium]